VHALMCGWLLADERNLLALACLDLLVLLGQVAWYAVAGQEAVCAAIALQAVFLSDLASLYHLEDPL